MAIDNPVAIPRLILGVSSLSHRMMQMNVIPKTNWREDIVVDPVERILRDRCDKQWNAEPHRDLFRENDSRCQVRQQQLSARLLSPNASITVHNIRPQNPRAQPKIPVTHSAQGREGLRAKSALHREAHGRT